MDRNRQMNILLVEDNPDHAELTLRALENGNLLNHVAWVKDGEEALDFLYRRRRYADPASSPRPGLILLDMKLPKLDGHEVLRRIKADETLRSIPVVMLTTSDRQEEIDESYRAGANSFVTKPVRFSEFVERVRTVQLYWVLTSRLPEVLEAHSACASAD
jgi:CheY-like chemotaxis protein